MSPDLTHIDTWLFDLDNTLYPEESGFMTQVEAKMTQFVEQVTGLPHAEDDQAIVRFVIGLAETLGIEVTAEGIERQEQADCLVELGCLRGQGYLYDRPVPAEHIFTNLTRPA